MPDQNPNSPFAFLRTTPAIVVSVLLLAEIAAFYSFPTKEYVPTPPPLDAFALEVGPWHMSQNLVIDAYTQSFLKADDTLTRRYAGPSDVELFVAFFKSQRGGVTPHSPKVCLPGNGWTEESSGTISVNVPGESSPISINRYVVGHGEERDMVLYWYQNPYRVTANEYLSKFFLIWDALRHNRSDEALIRVIRTIPGNNDDAAQQQAVDFVRTFYQPLKQQMWMKQSSAALLP